MDTETLNYDDATKGANHDMKTPSNISPLRRRSSALSPVAGSAVEEKKRNQRLFGSLLGTLSQSGSKANSAHKKRDEIEARQRERLRREKEEQEAERKRQRVNLVKKRQHEHEKWVVEGLKIKYENMRATAGFLKTLSEPALYYRPWELREDEQEQIKRQKDEVERQIRQSQNEQPQNCSNSTPDKLSQQKQQADHDQEMEDTAIESDTVKPLEEEAVDFANKSAGLESNENDLRTKLTAPQTEQLQKSEDDDSHKDDDNHGEELVEGQEDDVIY